MNRLVVTDNVNPWHNLALEEHLFNTQGEGATLYLWQNRNTVVIGRNQNAWKECRTELLEKEGGLLARRSSGGGAVYHDMGNLNFTFVLPRKDYDLARQFAVLQRAAAAFGVETEVSGRNDVILKDGGAKFSGNAFRFTADMALQHGTILISADMDRLSRYLAPSKRKLQAKGVESVRARVCNLQEIAPDVTISGMRHAMTEAFAAMYGAYERVEEPSMDAAEIRRLTQRFASWDWRFGKTPRFDISFAERFSWGEIEILLHCEQGHVAECVVYSDAMDEALPTRLAAAIKNAPFSPEAIAERVSGADNIADAIRRDIAEWMITQSC